MSSTTKKVPKVMTKEMKDAEDISNIKRFKGTIVVCSIYAGLSLLILMLVLFTETGKVYLANELFTLTITLVGGMLFVAIVLALFVYAYKSENIVYTFDSRVCPDYWLLKTMSEEDLNKNVSSTADYSTLRYYCEPDPSVWNMQNMSNTFPTAQSDDSDAVKNIRIGLDEMKKKFKNPTAPEVVNNCKRIYPTYISAFSKSVYDTDSNELQCAISKKCNLPWSSVCSDPQ